MSSSNIAVSILNEYIDSVLHIGSLASLDELDLEYKKRLEASAADSGFVELLEGISGIASRLIKHNESCHGLSHRERELSEQEQEENRLVQQLLDKNLFTYHFQPIIRADNGEIYAYEALMRAGGMAGITPFHILKYAELTGRLGEVEQYTFTNVLSIVNSGRDAFFGRPVFINSMPNIRLSPESILKLEKLLKERLGNIVIEMTESAEYDDNELETIKEKYTALDIPIAIDDYGTGYSNISNLLRYTPNYVKIDRSLLSGIESSPNKKHFVREIIDFCHENNIMALAEGVESSQELRTVILLGADLIQGFYTARPAAEVLRELPFKLRSEIRAHRQELEDGRRLKIYTAERNERISLERLSKDGYSCIQIGSSYADGRVTVLGKPHHDSGIHIVAADGFGGEIALENARLSNLAGRPCIDIGQGSRVTLSLVGSNMLIGGGVRVPEGAFLTVKGDGGLDIRLGDADYYGIGNDLSSKHGDLEFLQDGTVSISASSHAGVGIGSGLGGNINIGRGRYVFSLAGSSNIAIGAFDGDTNIEMLGCDFESTATGAFSVGIGTASGTADIHMMYSSVRLTLDSQLAAGIGSLYGKYARVRAESVSISTEMSADTLTVFGALGGRSDVKLERLSVNITADGAEAIAFGGTKGDAELTISDIDFTAKISNAVDVCTYADSNNVHIKGGRYRLDLNGKKLESIKGV